MVVSKLNSSVNYPEIKKKIVNFCNLKLSGYKKFSKNYQFKNQLVFFGTPLLKRRHFWDVGLDNYKLLKNQFNILDKTRAELQAGDFVTLRKIWALLVIARWLESVK